MRIMFEKFASMLRILNRCVTQSGKGICLRRKRHSAASVLCLKWERTEFNGVDVDLSQLSENCSLEEFNVRLKGRSMPLHYNSVAKTLFIVVIK